MTTRNVLPFLTGTLKNQKRGSRKNPHWRGKVSKLHFNQWWLFFIFVSTVLCLWHLLVSLHCLCVLSTHYFLFHCQVVSRYLFFCVTNQFDLIWSQWHHLSFGLFHAVALFRATILRGSLTQRCKAADCSQSGARWDYAVCGQRINLSMRYEAVWQTIATATNTRQHP